MKPTTKTKYKEIKQEYLKKNTKLLKVPSGAVFEISAPNMFNLIGMEALDEKADKRTEARYIVNACLVEPKIDVEEIVDADLMELYLECLKF